MSKPDNPQEVAEVVNYIAAVNYGLERLKDLPVSLRLIREIHKELMQGVRGSERDPGEFRKTQNWIGPEGCSLAQATYVPPPPHEMIQALDNLEKFLHDSTPIPALLKVGLAHAQFETIHPFLDGNGRTGRLLITFLLCEQNILKRPLLYISHYFKKYRTEYYDRLQAVRDTGNWEGWLKFFLRGVYEVAQEASATARKIVNLTSSPPHRRTGIPKTHNLGFCFLAPAFRDLLSSGLTVAPQTACSFAFWSGPPELLASAACPAAKWFTAAFTSRLW